MISEKVQKEIDSAGKFGEQLEDIVVSKNQFPTGDRNVLLIAYWALMVDYRKGILSLLQSEFFGAAFVRASRHMVPIRVAIAALRVRCGGSSALQQEHHRMGRMRDTAGCTHAEIALEQSGQILWATFASECALT